MVALSAPSGHLPVNQDSNGTAHPVCICFRRCDTLLKHTALGDCPYETNTPGYHTAQPDNWLAVCVSPASLRNFYHLSNLACLGTGGDSRKGALQHK
jgi:hypothetical protein